MERMGHSSVGGMRAYKRTTEIQKEEISDLMLRPGPSKKLCCDLSSESENNENCDPNPKICPPTLTSKQNPGATFSFNVCNVNISYATQ